MATSEKWYSRWSRSAPWYFHSYGIGRSNVVVSADRQLIAADLPADVGSLVAAAPTLYATLYQIEKTLHPHDPRAITIRRVLARADSGKTRLSDPLQDERTR